MEYVQMKKSRKKINNGDIFLLKKSETEIFYGRILCSNIVSEINSLNGKVLITFYKKTYKESILEIESLSKEKYIESFFLVTKTFWAQGIFETMGQLPLSNEEELDLENYYFYYNYFGRKIINIYNQEFFEKETQNRKIESIGFPSIGYIFKVLEKETK